MNTRIMTCEVHGEYQQNEVDSIKKLFNEDCEEKMWVGYCEECVSENNRRKIEDEKSRIDDIMKANRDNRRLNSGISKRNLNKTFDDYSCEAGSKQEAAKRKFLQLKESLENGKGFNVIACGGVGTGKTLLSSALIDAVCDKIDCEIVAVMDLIRSFKGTWAKNSEYSEKDVIKHYARLDLLIIDEVGVQYGSETERLFIFDIINGRYENMLPTVILSNLSIEMVKDAIGERVIDRLRDDGGQLVVFDWESMRGKK